ncbi:glycosyltransferase [Marinobacterium zhoushanense]|nr:glycosyltransferase [Marinobacterium zhoushanense]
MTSNEKKIKWLGIHDHANYAAKWLDQETPYSWLRVFEKADCIERHAFLREGNLSHKMSGPIRGVNYRFFKEGFESWVEEIEKLSPDVILYNLCWYSDAIKPLVRLKASLPNSIHIIRVHHDVSYLSMQRGFKETVLECDVAIVPTENQAEELRNIGFSGDTHVLPFGINQNEFNIYKKEFKERRIDIISATNTHPARNLPLLNKVYEKLTAKGINVKNVVGLPRTELSELLGDSKIFLLTSMTEASGSRIMLEAIAAGCYPIAFAECRTAKEVLDSHGFGTVINTEIKLKMPQKKVKVPFFAASNISNRIHTMLNELKGFDGSQIRLSDDYFYDNEIEKLLNILRRYG